MSEMNCRTWYAVDILVEPEATEAVEFAFNTLDALGTEIDGLRKKKDEPVIVTGFFDTEQDASAIDAALSESLGIYLIASNAVKSITNRAVEETDWLAEWKRHWKPTEIGKFIIAPPWSEVEKSDKIVIRIEPNMAFGTGTHETTQLCLTAIGENYTEGASFLDVGTGTGILAIALAKLSVTSKIFACDTDTDSVKIAKENGIANGVCKLIEFVEGPISGATPAYDFVCANLTIDVIIPILSLLIDKTKFILLLSGILAEQKSEIVAELLKFRILDYEIAQSGEWISVLVHF